MFSFIDNLIDKLTGDAVHCTPTMEQYDFIRANIIAITNGAEKTILVTSSCMTQAELSEFCANLTESFRSKGHDSDYVRGCGDSICGYDFIVAAGVQKNAHAIELARAADCAILVEAKGRSLYPQIEHCKVQLADIGCETIGCVFYDK